MSNTLDTPYVFFEIKEDILFATYKKGISIDLPIAKGIVASRLDFTEGRNMLVVVLIEGVVTIEKSARYFISSADGVKGLIAAAIIIDSPFAAVIGNFFSSINKPEKIPVRLFTHPSRALKWLRKFPDPVTPKSS